MSDNIFTPKKVCSTYVKDDGTTPFQAPQGGLDALSEDQLVTLRQLQGSQNWSNSKPVDGTVGFVKIGTQLPSNMSLQQIMDAVFYNKYISIDAPKQAFEGSIVTTKIIVKGEGLTKITIKYQGKTQEITSFSTDNTYYVQSDKITDTITWEVAAQYTDNTPIQQSAITSIADETSDGSSFLIDVNVTGNIELVHYNYDLYGSIQEKGILKITKDNTEVQFTVQSCKNKDSDQYTFSPIIFNENIYFPVILDYYIQFVPVSESTIDLTDIYAQLSNLSNTQPVEMSVTLSDTVDFSSTYVSTKYRPLYYKATYTGDPAQNKYYKITLNIPAKGIDGSTTTYKVYAFASRLGTNFILQDIILGTEIVTPIISYNNSSMKVIFLKTSTENDRQWDILCSAFEDGATLTLNDFPEEYTGKAVSMDLFNSNVQPGDIVEFSTTILTDLKKKLVVTAVYEDVVYFAPLYQKDQNIQFVYISGSTLGLYSNVSILKLTVGNMAANKIYQYNFSNTEKKYWATDGNTYESTDNSAVDVSDIESECDKILE